MSENEVINILKSYALYDKFISSQEYAKEYFNPNEQITVSDEVDHKNKMRVIEEFVKLLEPSNEYTLLHLRYIKNIPIEKCAECMFISRSTAFRLLKKAHKAIHTIIQKTEKEQK